MQMLSRFIVVKKLFWNNTLKICAIFLLLSISLFANAISDDPWSNIRKERIKQLLPSAMQAANVDAWVVVCRENNNDPLAKHVGCENAGQTAVFLFYFDNLSFNSVAFSPVGEATALRERQFLDKVIDVARDASSIVMTVEFLEKQQFDKIAINVSDNNAQADGLSHSQYVEMTKAMGKEMSAKLVSSDDVVYEWLSIKLDAEVDIMRKAAELTAKWQLEAYAQVVPGKTTDKDVGLFLKKKMAEAGVTDGWAAAQNPNVVSGTDRGHSHATDKVIMPGDVIQTDFGIRVHDTWVTDIQRFAYVLRPGETVAPDDIQHYWKSAVSGREAAFKAMKPGATGQQVDAAQRVVMQETNSLPVMWSTGHPVGYVAHDTGPALSDGLTETARATALKPLKQGMTFAFDGFHSWLLSDGSHKTISVEEMVVITKNGAKYLIPPQQNLILISSEKSD